ncbi:MAG: ATP-binding protein, partial [Ketobacteraceae bacterium]|nr:ATP-binding protein [Ketobacteraceae bacterium]
LLVISIIVWRSGNRSARYYTIAWATLIAGIVMINLNKLGVLPRNLITEHAMQLGVLLEALLLSFALADRINRERREKFEAQKLAIHNENLAREEHERYLQTKLKAEVDELKAKEATIQARAESKAKSEFLAAMSHEIRTPMNGVVGMCDILKQGQLDPQSRYYVDIIDSSGKALLTLINDILDYSKIEAGKMEIEQINFDLAQLIREVIAVFELMAQRKDLKLRSYMEEGTPTLLKGDPNRLRQILLNLLGNAFKFTEKGGITLSVCQVDSDNDKLCLRFEVTDTGIGISEEGQRKLFSDFAQAESSTSRVYGGTGLGLSISRKLVNLMGGEINVQSELHKGSCFWFTALVARADEDFVPASKEARTTDYQPLTDLRVLVAEDNTVNQMVISSMLKKLGVAAEVVEDGEKALACFQKHHDKIDAVLMDCVMPVKDGYQTTREIREFESRQGLNPTPVFALTAHAMSEHREQSLECGMNGHLSKPIEFQRLYEVLAPLSRPAQASGTNG